ncbi:rhodanese-like domain-containing protein [Prolixibacteraceae bacterium Z1-6]|uniref:Rhodanese-like domain-containing protein n=1 Tax=Draconibacterium aestuarii TaxID=2998507 RepID=A0A9X3J7E3_9BACT|nr:rhodanese-like domain-containing protein [Prolixibacteraceae bacterium Z1-6]
MRKAIILLILSFVVFACQNQPIQNPTLTNYENGDALVAAAKEVIKEITIEDFKSMYDGDDYFVLIDVRTTAEYDAGYIPGAASIPRGVLEFRIGKEEVWDEMGLYIPEKTDPIVVNCRTGGRSALAAKSLMELGYQNVLSLQGGWKTFHETYPELIEKIIIDDAESNDHAAEAQAAAGGC